MEIGASSHANRTTESYVTHLNPTEHLTINSEQVEPSPEKLAGSKNKRSEAPFQQTAVDCVENDAAVPQQPNEHVNREDPQPPSTSRPNSNIGKYILKRTIGKGNFAKVKLAEHVATGVDVAIKIINKTVMDGTLLMRLKREINIMKVTNHPNIIKLLEIIENEDVLCLIMEYASGGEIFDYLVLNGKMREKEARAKFRQLISAIQYCHSKHIVHRDLKAENILLDRDLNVKVADFGLANTFDNKTLLKTFCGSPPYAAPELFLGVEYYGPGVDVWSLGVILFTLVVGQLPFDARDLRELRTKILGLHYSIPKGSVTPECESLLRKMLVLDPKDRPSLKFLMQDRWVNAGYSPEDFLRPYREPPKAGLDEVRVEAMQAMGFKLADLQSSVINPEFDHIYATYHLLPETPPQYKELYNDLSHTQQTQGTAALTLPNSLVTSKSPGSPTITAAASAAPTAIGRFTVAPSSSAATAESTEPSPLPQQQLLPHHPQHHSLTPTPGVSVWRAFTQIGRTLVGTADAPGNPGGPQKTPHQSMKTSNKPVIKPTDGTRTVITAAPVPMMPSKKSGLTVPSSKRASPASHPARISPSSALRTTGEESSPETTATRNSNLQDRFHQVMKLSPGGQQQQLAPVVNNERDAHKQKLHRTSSRKMPDSAKPGERRTPVPGGPSSLVDGTGSPLGKEEPTGRVSHMPSGPTTKASQPRSGATPNPASVASNQSQPGDTKQQRVSGNASACSSCSNTSTSSGTADREFRQTATVLVQNSIQFAEQLQQNSPCSSCSASSQASLVFANDLSAGSQKAKVGAPTPGGQNAKSPPVNPVRPAVPHTVQGHEARVLQDGSLRLQPSQEPGALSSTRGPSNYSTVDSHPNTWSRSVRKAFGGLFAQPKPQEHQAVRINSPREVRFPWSVHTTSTKPADELLQNIIRTLETTPGCRYTHDPDIPFLVTCSWANDRPALRPRSTNPEGGVGAEGPQVDEVARSAPTGGGGGLPSDDPVRWEMEVCQLPRLHLRGVRLKRIRGSAIQFRPIADMIMRALQL